MLHRKQIKSTERYLIPRVKSIRFEKAEFEVKQSIRKMPNRDTSPFGHVFFRIPAIKIVIEVL
jgi:hypothetical protein